MTPSRHLVSLGSSFAAGPGLPPLSNPSASRSSVNYPSLLSQRLSTTHLDLTVSGSTLLNILSQPQTSLFSYFDPQIQSVTPHADYITITAGGNDFGYIGGMAGDALEGSFVGRRIKWVFGIGGVVDLTEDELVERLRDVIDAVRERAPRGLILLVEYLTLIGDDSKAHDKQTPFTEEQLLKYKGQAEMLSRVYRRAVEGKERVRVVPIAKASLGHGVGSKDPWVTGWKPGKGKAPFHPNEEGMRQVARIIYEDLQSAGLA